MCFNCIFINGSDAKGCQAVYNNGSELGRVNISRIGFGGSSCIYTTHSADSHIKSVLFYDVESDGTVSDTMPAIELTGLNITLSAQLNVTIDSADVTSNDHLFEPTTTILPTSNSDTGNLMKLLFMLI